ncbi:MAG: UDP-N-acetylmuramoyl-tripeptide--D-alanyl-D-alanine ligase, partial [Eubacterium sp.]|nr:UDP-N-acetylmuramoyl-tripeptide--D-alanyl-D-alanine ligase [Eubacterium sp.]
MMTISEAAAACGGELIHAEGCGGRTWLGGQFDSRKVEDGNLFFAIKGNNTDGHNYVNKAFELGAAAAVAEHDVEGALGPIILVESSEKAIMAV